MATGWAHDGAVQEQIDSTIDDAVQRARQQLPQGPSAEYCQNCDEPIPEGRRQAIAGVQLCIACQTLEDQQASHSGYNRRASKDSQLR
ncbi:DksA/TraR family C4-type zinc finger protein [Pseudomonas sp. C27(2019)]|uniref:DksA/TraR family C4-type zinc finger protein n=1 Tax=Pseudomonas sp. C27(2019) TaxID=2604941 RepID=UPI001248E701|nr:DksA/TraR family C4-type zinc finger protein [Pseudomonas sp. C27(2019)]QEY60050.1 DksA/TraR family C4-type zinc finger protein [Pseudomonas sp. C27(2019)]